MDEFERLESHSLNTGECTICAIDTNVDGTLNNLFSLNKFKDSLIPSLTIISYKLRLCCC